MTASDLRPQSEITKVLLTAEEAAQALSVSRTLVFRFMGSGELYSVKVGGLRRIPVASLYEFIGRLVQR